MDAVEQRARATVLVTGATGRVGRHVVAGLLAAGAAVRAATRDPSSARLPDEVDVRRVDLTDPSSLGGALDGVDVVFLVWPSFTSEDAPAVVDLLAERVRRVVYLSAEVPGEAMGGHPPGFHGDVERLLARSGLEWTFLRATGFAANAEAWAEQIRSGEVVRGPYANATRSPVHEADVAAVAVGVLLADGRAGQALVVTGPEALTMAEQVRTIGEVIGRPLRYQELPPQAAREELVATWGDAGFADEAMAAWAAMVHTPEPVTGTVEELTGAPARTFRQWVTDHADDFGADVAAAASTPEVAEAYVALYRAGRYDSAMNELISPDVVRVEPGEGGAPPKVLHGLTAVQRNSEEFALDTEVEGLDVDGPFVGGDRFAVRFTMHTRSRATGERGSITKVSLYTVSAGKLSREEVYFGV